MVSIKYYCWWWLVFDLLWLVSSSEFPLLLLLYVVVGIPLHLHQALMYLCSLIMITFQHHNIIRVGTSIESDAQYTILMFSIPLHVPCHLCLCITCEPFQYSISPCAFHHFRLKRCHLMISASCLFDVTCYVFLLGL